MRLGPWIMASSLACAKNAMECRAPCSYGKAGGLSLECGVKGLISGWNMLNN